MHHRIKQSMQKSTLLFLLLGLFSIGSTLAAKQIPFSQFGYPENSVLNGPKAAATFYFKQTEGLDYAESFVHLEIISSQILNKNISTITFLVGDQPVFSSFLKDYGDTLRIDLPIRKNQVQSGFLKLEIESNLFLNDEECREYDEPSLWLNVTSESFFQEGQLVPTKTKPNWKIDQYVPIINQLIIPKNFSAETADLVSYLHYYFKKTRNEDLKINYLEDLETSQLDRALIFGTGKELALHFPEEKNLGNRADQGELRIAYRHYLDVASQDSLYTSSLLLTGGDRKGLEKAIQFLFNQDLTTTAFTDQLKVLESTKTDSIFQSELKASFTLEELGFGAEQVTGMGKITKNLSLPNYLTKSDLKSLTLHLKINHKPISANESGFANIYINNDLIGSYKLNESGILDELLYPTQVTFGTRSFIGIEYIYLPAGGLCGTTASEFYAQIDPKESTLEPIYYNILPLTFYAFPKNFSGAPLEILYDYDISKTDISAISDLVALINTRYESTFQVYFPRFVRMDAERKSLETNSNKIFLTRTPSAYHAVLQKNQYITFHGDSVGFRSDDIPRFFDLKYKDDFAFLQLFVHNGSKIFMINDITANHQALQNALVGVEDQYLTNSGNVMISNGERYYFFDLRNTELKNKAEETKNSFEEFWKTFRVFFILILVAFIIILLSYIFKKSKIAKKNIEDAR
jgi:hypothetical protein